MRDLALEHHVQRGKWRELVRCGTNAKRSAQTIILSQGAQRRAARRGVASAQDWQAEWSVVQSCLQVYCLRQLAEVRQRYSLA